MSSYRGTDGAVYHGGVLVGSPLVQGATAQGESTATFDAASLSGVVLSGDTFTVAGDGQTYTISATAVAASNEIDVSFTPTVQPGGGWSDNAAVTFTANSVANIRAWELDITRPVLDVTVMGDSAVAKDLDIPEWTGSIEALFDYGDTEQAEFVDRVKAGTSSTAVGFLVRTAASKNLYGTAQPSGAVVTSERGAIVGVRFNVAGSGALGVDWN